MISKAQIKFIQSLHLKKNRSENQLFIAEGTKIIDELLQSNQYQIHSIYTTNTSLIKQKHNSIPIYEINTKELAQISTLTTPNQLLAIVHIPQLNSYKIDSNQQYIALEDIHDPGNLGTIIRTADWFGIDTIFCSLNCVEYTNPKVIMASMGSFLRTKLYYTDLKQLFASSNQMPVLGASLDGQNIYEKKLPSAGFLLIGSESHGISSELYTFVKDRIKIPSYGAAESLNASIANAIILSEWKRQINGRK